MVRLSKFFAILEISFVAYRRQSAISGHLILVEFIVQVILKILNLLWEIRSWRFDLWTHPRLGLVI